MAKNQCRLVQPWNKTYSLLVLLLLLFFHPRFFPYRSPNNNNNNADVIGLLYINTMVSSTAFRALVFTFCLSLSLFVHLLLLSFISIYPFYFFFFFAGRRRCLFFSFVCFFFFSSTKENYLFACIQQVISRSLLVHIQIGIDVYLHRGRH